MKTCYGCLTLLMILVGCSQSVSEVRSGEAGPTERLAAIEVPTDSWPWWRGPNRDNVAHTDAAPVTWSDVQNVLWKTPVAGRGHASPIVWEDQVFVASADEQQEKQLLFCYSLANGRQRWSRELHEGGLMRVHMKNSQASATPACDGQRVYAAFIANDGLWVTAIDLDGKLVWKQQAGPFKSEHGYGSSPALHESLVIVAADSADASYVSALHRKTGQIVWRTRRAGGISRSGGGSYGTPIVADVAGRMQLLLSGRGQTISYDPDTGKELWACDGPAETTANTLAFSGDLVFAGAGFPEQGVMAIRADGSGDVSDTHVVWHRSDLKAYVPSPLAVDNRIIVARDNGVVTCLDSATGKDIWTKRMGGDFSASPTLAAGNVYVPNERGTVYVFELGDKFKSVATNDLQDGGFASPVFAGSKLLLRTNQYLYCIGSGLAE